MIVDSSGSREIATIDHLPAGEFDQTPEYWRCNTCEHVNPFDSEGPINGFLAPLVSDYMDDMECRKCGGPFTEDNWVISPFWVYLGTWNGKVVAEGGPWHWSAEWHRDRASENHTKDDCYSVRRSGRRRRENPCINKSFAAESDAKPPIPPIMIVDTDHHSLPPPSAGLTPFQEEHGYGSDRETAPGIQQQDFLHPDNQTVGTGGFTIGDYARDDGESVVVDEPDARGLAVPDDDQEPDLGSYYDTPVHADELVGDGVQSRALDPSPLKTEQVPPEDDDDGVVGPVGNNYYAPLMQQDSTEVEPPLENGKHNPQRMIMAGLSKLTSPQQRNI
jgi:collagen type V/XI/XXIV/XXVII alpha